MGIGNDPGKEWLNQIGSGSQIDPNLAWQRPTEHLHQRQRPGDSAGKSPPKSRLRIVVPVLLLAVAVAGTWFAWPWIQSRLGGLDLRFFGSSADDLSADELAQDPSDFLAALERQGSAIEAESARRARRIATIESKAAVWQQRITTRNRESAAIAAERKRWETRWLRDNERLLQPSELRRRQVARDQWQARQNDLARFNRYDQRLLNEAKRVLDQLRH